MPSPKLAHIILNTSNFDAVKQWYMEVLEATVGVETSDHSVCFLRTDESHHRFGIFRAAETDDSIAVVVNRDVGTLSVFSLTLTAGTEFMAPIPTKTAEVPLGADAEPWQVVLSPSGNTACASASNACATWRNSRKASSAASRTSATRSRIASRPA